jgi:hypothetical protein
MKIDPRLPNRLRSAFGTLAFLSIAVATIAFGASFVLRSGLEKDAVAEAGKVAGTIVQPALDPQDVLQPMTGDRYAALRQIVRKRVLAPPVTSIEIWNEDGTIVFADRRSRVGEQVPAMRAAIHDAKIEGSSKLVEGDTFRALVGIGVGDAAAVVELDRPMAGIEETADRWLPWVRRGMQAAVVFLALWVAAVALSLIARRGRARQAEQLPQKIRTGNAPPTPEEDAHVNVRRRKTDRPDGVSPDAPAYMQPGFREHLEARREAEDALSNLQQALRASELDRERLQQRLEQTEAELQEARRRLAELGATAGR